MTHSPIALGLLMAFPLLGSGANAAGPNATPAPAPSAEARLLESAPSIPVANADVTPPAPVADAPALETEPRCAELDKRKQLRGRLNPAIVRMAGGFLNLPMGAGRFVSHDGRRYAFCLERHYHPPGFERGPVGWHKGVTVYDAA